MKKIIVLISIFAFSCLLVSCTGKKSDTESLKKESKSQGRVADFPELYKDFFDYTFDGNYTINIAEDGVINEDTDNEQAYCYYDISYVRKDGTERTAKVVSREFIENEKENYESEQRMNNEELNAFCVNEINEIFIKEFIDNILSKYVDITYKEDETLYSTDEYTCYVSLTNPNYLFSKDYDYYEKGCSLIDSHISPETGYKLSEADLKTAANDKEFLIMVSFIINTDTDVQSYIEKMENIISDYFVYAGTPMNCSFVIKETTDNTVGTTKIVYNRNFLMGEEIDIEEKKKADKKFKIQKEIVRICLEE